MNDGAFAVWNTSDVRHNKTSFFCSLEYVLTEAFESMGMNLYNKLILMRSISSLPIHTSTNNSQTNEKLAEDMSM